MLFHGHSGIARTSEALGLRVNRDNVIPLNTVGVCVHGLGGQFFFDLQWTPWQPS